MKHCGRQHSAGGGALWLALLFVPAASLQAADSTWTNVAGGAFSVAGNWSAGVPGESDKATFDKTAAYTVTWDRAFTNANATFKNAGAATLEIGSHEWLITNKLVVAENSLGTAVRLASGTLAVSNAFDAWYGYHNSALTVTNGATLRVGGKARVGNNSVSNTLLVAGQGSLLSLDGAENEVMMAASRSNLMMVADGGTLRVSTGYLLSYNGPTAWGNRVVVDGAGSVIDVMKSFFYLRGNGGRHLVSNGGQIFVTNHNFNVESDNNYGSQSNRVEIIGGGSRLSAKNVYCGRYTGAAATPRADNDNLIRVADGGTLAITQNIIMGGTNNQLTAEGSGALIRCKELHMAMTPQGTVLPGLLIANGAMLTNDVLSLGSLAGSRGEMIVTGPGAAYEKGSAGSLYVAFETSATARMAVEDGGLANVRLNGTEPLHIGAKTNSVGTLHVGGTGSLLRVTGPGGVLVGEYGQGTLSVSNGAAAVASQLTLGLQPSSSNNLLAISGQGSVVTNSGACVLSSGTLRFTADAQGFGTLRAGGNLTVTPGVKLAIDARALQSKKGLFTLATYASKSGAFADPADIVLTGSFGKVFQTSTNLTVALYPLGTMISVR